EVKFKISDKNAISANILHSGDKLDFLENDIGASFRQDEVNIGYGNSYGWLTLNSVMNPHLFIRTVLSLYVFQCY
ncbi:MAG: hypothetical protein ACFFDN_30985, partial [Candidatus Hodarchaeota archaeon]